MENWFRSKKSHTRKKMPAFIVALYSTSTLFHEAGLSQVTSAAESRHVILLVRPWWYGHDAAESLYPCIVTVQVPKILLGFWDWKCHEEIGLTCLLNPFFGWFRLSKNPISGTHPSLFVCLVLESETTCVSGWLWYKFHCEVVCVINLFHFEKLTVIVINNYFICLYILIVQKYCCVINAGKFLF